MSVTIESIIMFFSFLAVIIGFFLRIESRIGKLEGIVCTILRTLNNFKK